MEPRAVYADRGGYLGRLESTGAERSVLLLASGERVWVPNEVLAVRGDGALALQAPLLEVASSVRQPTESASASEPKVEASERVSSVEEPLRVPLVQEQLVVHKVPRARGGVSVHVVPQVERRLLEIPLREQHTEVRHVEIRKLVEQPPAVRYEGDTVVIPLLEEVLVVEKRLLLREEIHLIRRERTRVEQREVAVMSERAEVRRTTPPQR